MPGPDPSRLLREGLDQLGIPQPDRAHALLEKYLDEIERWNPRFGLVKAADREELVVKHVLDSLSAWNEVGDAAAQGSGGVLDVGSGAGFPGIPLAVTLPELSFTLLERMAKRASFLRTCAVLLGLSRVSVIQKELSETGGDFEVLTFRAVAPLERFLVEAVSGDARWRVIIAYKGRKERALQEIEAVRARFGARFHVEVRPLRTPFLSEERCIEVVTRTPNLDKRPLPE